MPPRKRRVENDDLTGRTGDIWRAYLSGETQEQIAKQHGIGQQRVSQILSAIRESIPETDRAHLVQRESEFLDQLRVEALRLVARDPIPAYSNGKPILMPDGTTAEDHSGRLAALDRAVRLHERLSKLLGLDAPAKADVSLVGAEREAATEAASAALAFLTGGTDAAGAGGTADL
jgi:hypothetical protein